MRDIFIGQHLNVVYFGNNSREVAFCIDPVPSNATIAFVPPENVSTTQWIHKAEVFIFFSSYTGQYAQVNMFMLLSKPSFKSRLLINL